MMYYGSGGWFGWIWMGLLMVGFWAPIPHPTARAVISPWASFTLHP